MRKFKRVYIEITNVCNLNCTFCPKTKRTKRFLNNKEFEIILDKIKPYTNYINLHLMGEPLLNSNLEEFLEIAYINGFKVNLTTNGTLLLDCEEYLLKSKAVRQINISLHSFEANSNHNFDKYFDNVLSFVEKANKDTDIICSMRLWNLDNNKEEGKNLLNLKIVNLIQQRFGYFDNIFEKLYQDKKLKLKDRVYLNAAEKFDWPDIDIEPLADKGFCHGLRDHIGILSDGTVVPCCLDSEGHMPLGNIFTEEFSDIINNNRANSIYQGFSRRERVEELCKRCGYSKVFDK